MVIFSEWHRTALDLKTSSCMPMTGEDTGLGALASPLAGYLGKVQGRAASLEYCPWCASKGFSYALRSYRINLQESITLCTNPLCLFPLVTRPLEDVLASLDPVEPTAGNKRKMSSVLETGELIKPPLKSLRLSEDEAPEPVCPAERGAVTLTAPEPEEEKANGYHSASPHAETTGWTSLQDEDVVQQTPSDRAAGTADLAPPTRSSPVGNLSGVLLATDEEEPAPSPGLSETDLPQRNSTETIKQTVDKSQTAAIMCKTTDDVKPGSQDLSRVSSGEPEALESVPEQLFWSNTHNLCWLDSTLAVLVSCKSLKRKPNDEPQRSPVWQLIKGHEDICAAVQEHKRTGRDGVTRVPSHVLQQANLDLHTLRMSAFQLLQPKLHCKLGQRETPVFALPLLLSMDPWLERLFQLTFQWEFKCTKCKVTTRETVTKILPTFTNIVPDWQPLHAVHFGPCNMCSKKNQRRTMLLDRVPAVFALHFVEGLPDNDVSMYAFDFKGKHYAVSAVIQYRKQLRHFSLWLSNGDGSWLEYDDLQHPYCKTHPGLELPADEMHVVFWEEEESEPSVCSPSTTFVESPPLEKQGVHSLGDRAGEPLAPGLDGSLLMTHEDTALAAGVDTSIGATTLLDTFEGLSPNDIITLTLVELNADSETPALPEDQQTQDQRPSTRADQPSAAPDGPAPDGPAPAAGSHAGPPDPAPPPANPSSSDTHPKENSSGGPACVPAAASGRGKGRGPGKAVRRPRGKKAASSKAASHASPPTRSEPSEAAADKSAGKDNVPPAAATQPASPVSSSNTSPLSSNQTGPAQETPVSQDTHWSFRLSRHPLGQGQRSLPSVAPTHRPPPNAQTKSPDPVHSTPNLVRRPPLAVGLPSPQLSTDESGGFPPKAAEMYGGFATKSAPSPGLPLPPAPPRAKSKEFQSMPSNHQTHTTVISTTSPPATGAKQGSEILSSMKHSSQSSKVLPGPGDTEALRYKLIKKLKAKKKKLAKLNNLLGCKGDASVQSNGASQSSPGTVTSSTYDGSTCDDFLSDLLSPTTTTASSLSPDSTDFLEMLTSGQDGVDRFDCRVPAAGSASQNNSGADRPNTENFLEEFFSQCFESS
ncbi:SUMO-specific isopeptidase USPL1 isoform 1-T2 [Menidia menidia]